MDENISKSRKDAAKRQKLWRDKHKKEAEYKNMRKKQNKMYYDKVKEMSTESAKAVTREKARLRKRKSRELANVRRKGKQKQQLTPQALGKMMKRVEKKLPRSPTKKQTVIEILAQNCGIVPKIKKSHKDNLNINVETQKIVADFYIHEDISRVDPSAKSALVKQKKNQTTIINPRRHLLFTIREAYCLFKETFPDVNIGKSSFAALRPNYIKPYKDIPQNVCICRYHENIEAVHKAVSSILPSFKKSLKDFINLVCCDTSSYECMNSDCAICEDSIKESFEVQIDDPEKMVSYCQWKKIDRRFEKIVLEETISDSLLNFRNQLYPFLLHIFIQTNTQAYFDHCKKKTNSENIVMQVDFAENYTCLYQDEIQSAHWSNPQVTVFTAVIWYETNKVKSYAIISDNISHDRFSVNVFLRKILTQYLTENALVKNISIFSDGCASQFKQKYNFANMTTIKSDFDLTEYNWTFFATAHGKGAVDGIGAVVKRYVWNEVRAKKAVVRNAADFVKIVQGKTKINILLVPEEEIEKTKESISLIWEKLPSLKGTQKVHFVTAEENATIHYKPYPQYESCNIFTFNNGNDNEEKSDNMDSEVKNLFCPIVENKNVQSGQWVIVKYDNVNFHGIITDVINENYQIKCLVPTKVKGIYKFEPDDDIIWYKGYHIVEKTSAPTLINSRGFYKL